MDAFEALVADIFWNQGYWVRTGIKVNLTREDKLRIGLPSAPRWEIDLVAFKPTENEFLVLECKSYLDSRGVHAAHFEPGAKLAGRYKLFHDPTLRDVILAKLVDQLASTGLVPRDTVPKFGLVYGHATPFNETRLRSHFDAQNWLLYGQDWINARLREAADGGYENSTAALVAKLLLRKQVAGITPVR